MAKFSLNNENIHNPSLSQPQLSGQFNHSTCRALQAHTADAPYLDLQCHYHISLVQAPEMGTHRAMVIPTSSLVPVLEP